MENNFYSLVLAYIDNIRIPWIGNALLYPHYGSGNLRVNLQC